jgi:hypothetical protein
MLTYFIGQAFWYGMFFTPLVAFLIVRNMQVAILTKYLFWLIISTALAALWFFISMSVFFGVVT